MRQACRELLCAPPLPRVLERRFAVCGVCSRQPTGPRAGQAARLAQQPWRPGKAGRRLGQTAAQHSPQSRLPGPKGRPNRRGPGDLSGSQATRQAGGQPSRRSGRWKAGQAAPIRAVGRATGRQLRRCERRSCDASPCACTSAGVVGQLGSTADRPARQLVDTRSAPSSRPLRLTKGSYLKPW